MTQPPNKRNYTHVARSINSVRMPMEIHGKPDHKDHGNRPRKHPWRSGPSQPKHPKSHTLTLIFGHPDEISTNPDWLVIFNHLEKYDFINGKDSPMYENKIHVWNHQRAWYFTPGNSEYFSKQLWSLWHQASTQLLPDTNKGYQKGDMATGPHTTRSTRAVRHGSGLETLSKVWGFLICLNGMRFGCSYGQ